MKIPKSNRKKALILVDVQPDFVYKRKTNTVRNIQDLLKSVKYEAYVECIFHAEKGSLWDKETGWTLPKNKKFHTVGDILKLLPEDTIHIEKTTKSAFKGNKNIEIFLKKKGIKEVHIVGFDTNDCVLATAYESFDLGFFTYVIEECVQSSSSNKINEHALNLLRHVNLTNKSFIV